MRPASTKTATSDGASRLDAETNGEVPDDDSGDEVVLEGTLVCALTGEHKPTTPQEETLQSFIEQLHREYGVELADMERDVRVESTAGEEGGKQKRKTRPLQIAVYDHGKPHEIENLVRAVLVAKPGTKADKAIDLLEEVLG